MRKIVIILNVLVFIASSCGGRNNKANGNIDRENKPFQYDESGTLYSGSFAVSPDYFAELTLTAETEELIVLINGKKTSFDFAISENLEELFFFGLCVRTDDFNSDGYVDFEWIPNCSARFPKSYVYLFDKDKECFVISSEDNENDTIVNEESEDENTPRWKISFKDLSEVASNYGTWINANEKDSTASLALVFDLYDNDTLNVCYSTECWLAFPYKIEDDKITVYWDVNVDSKYKFDIVKAIEKADKKLIGKPFMILELENDHTLKATYLMKDLIERINRASETKRIFFPDKYYATERSAITVM